MIKRTQSTINSVLLLVLIRTILNLNLNRNVVIREQIDAESYTMVRYCHKSIGHTSFTETSYSQIRDQIWSILPDVTKNRTMQDQNTNK